MSEHEQAYDLVEIFMAIAEGDVKAFDTFYHAWRSKVFRVMFKMTRSVEVSQDLSQQFFIKFWIKRQTLSSLQAPEAYVFRSLYNMATDYLRSKGHEQRWQELDQLVMAEATNSTQERLDERQARLLIQEAIEALPDRQKMIVHLRHEGVSYEAIAADMNISKGTAQNYYHEALKQLRRHINGRR